MSDDGIVRLVPRSERADAAYTDEVQVSAIATLERALEAARAGRCHGAAVVLLYADGSYSTAISKHRGVDRMIGAAQTLVHRLLTGASEP